MTEAGLRAAWLRWMHRRDVEADLDQVMEFARAKVINRLRYRAPDAGWDAAELMEEMPRAWMAAGLIFLHELAQDDEGLMRERQFFAEAMQDWHMRHSIDAGPAVIRAGGCHGA